jgi:hypothetical protein
MNILSIRICAAVCASTLVVVPALAIAEPGDMLHMVITKNVQLAAAPGAPPIILRKDVCLSKEHDPRELSRIAQRDVVCTISNYKQVFDQDGNSTKFHETCSGPTQGNASFTMELGGVHGQIHVDGKLNGQTVSIDTTIDGAVTGRCDFKPPRATH